MRFVSLFAGVGGFDLGLERAGMTCVGQVEIDKHARGILARHWPDVPHHDDVKTAKDWADQNGITGNVELVCGGFPCQDVSVAGRRAGLAGNRTGLFWDALNFATHVQAQWIILENVPGLFSSNNGHDFPTVIGALRDAGFHYVEWRVFDSQFYGVPQRRRRVFIVGHTRNPSRFPLFVERESSTRSVKAMAATETKVAQDPAQCAYASGSRIMGTLNASDAKGVGSQYVSEGKLIVHPIQSTAIGRLPHNGGNGRGFGHENASMYTLDLAGPHSVAVVPDTVFEINRRDGIRIHGEVTPTLQSFMGTGGNNVPMIQQPSMVRRVTPTECERLQGFPDGWTEGQADSHRYKQMGNAVTVNVAEVVGRFIMDSLK